jgi:hypothetical protein
MKTTQYKEIVETRKKKEKEKLDTIKSLLLLDGKNTIKA